MELAYELQISASEINAGVKRLVHARLAARGEDRNGGVHLLRSSLLEFVIHGVKYAYPPERGSVTRGMPTAHATLPLSEKIAASSEPPPVWPDPEGRARGYSFSPLYPTVPRAASVDQGLYELLALVDAIRDGRARERKLAEKMLKARIEAK